MLDSISEIAVVDEGRGESHKVRHASNASAIFASNVEEATTLGTLSTMGGSQ